jgi:DNA-binding CsgD family transcriptional regulator
VCYTFRVVTPRQAQLLLLLVSDVTLPAAAVRLNISYQTAKMHIRLLKKQRGIKTATALGAWVVSNRPAIARVARQRTFV